jgi:hypothetical protein
LDLYDDDDNLVGQATGGSLTPQYVDTDGDGCSDADEDQTAIGSQTSGGRRNSQYVWDYFNPSHDRLNRVDDIVLVVQAYFHDDDDGSPGLPPYELGYSPDTDRTNAAGYPNPWNTGLPDGLQRVQDIVHAINQYFHDCA